MNLEIGKYGRRYWALWDDEELVCVTVYKKGASRVKKVIKDFAQVEEVREEGGPYDARRISNR